MANGSDLPQALQFRPWPPGDPAPEIFQVIRDLDRRIQLQVVDAILDAQISIAKAHIEGLASIRKIVAGANRPG